MKKPVRHERDINVVIGPDITPEQAREAGLVMSGIAVSKGAPCACIEYYGSHHPDCPSCGLRNVLDALSIREILQNGGEQDEDRNTSSDPRPAPQQEG